MVLPTFQIFIQASCLCVTAYAPLVIRQAFFKKFFIFLKNIYRWNTAQSERKVTIFVDLFLATIHIANRRIFPYIRPSLGHHAPRV
jgi:hypothetical protein